MTDQPSVTTPEPDDDIDVAPLGDDFPPLTDPSMIPADQGDAGNV